MQEQYRLEMKNISKAFGGVQALNGVTLQVKAGEIHALIGENGAGKSTLMKILSGAYHCDAGEIILDGKKVSINTPHQAIELGIAVIYQEFMLAHDLTVAENIFIDRLTSGKKIINWGELKKRASEQLESLGFNDIAPMSLVSELSVAKQQVVEICKCLTRNSRILVLDEPTAVLTDAEIKKLFALLKKLRGEGVSIIYISHRLDEIMDMADRVTILKDGTLVETLEMKDVSCKYDLIKKMVGRELTQMYPPRNAKIGDVVLEVKNLKVGNIVDDVSFTVRAGEVVGFNGLVGAGRTEIMRAIFGADKIDSGEVYFMGKKVRFKNPKQSIKNGLGLLSEDRKKQGLLLSESIRVNSTITIIDKITHGGILRHKYEKQFTQDLLKKLSTKYGSVDDQANSLSGGNQQKVAISKWIAADCKCIIFDEPTRGVDVGAKVEIYRIINSMVEAGKAVIVISSEMLEIIGLCDRAIVMRNGKISGILSKNELSEENLIKLSMGV